MEIERNSRASRLSSNPGDRTSRHSRHSEVMSLERPSLHHRSSSLSHRASLISAMDLEPVLPDDLLLADDYRLSATRLSSQSREGYSFAADMEEKDLARKSQCKITHECRCCEEECLGVHCSCFLTPREICVIGQCCGRCLAAKNEYLSATYGFGRARPPVVRPEAELLEVIRQRNCKNMHYMKQVYANEPAMQHLVFCTCKKSQCQKKYCLCYERNQKCGEFCICVECANREQDDEEEEFRQEQQQRWERYATYKPYVEDDAPIDPDIEQYLDDPPEHAPFNETMEFEPVNFDSVLHNS